MSHHKPIHLATITVTTGAKKTLITHTFENCPVVGDDPADVLSDQFNLLGPQVKRLLLKVGKFPSFTVSAVELHKQISTTMW